MTAWPDDEQWEATITRSRRWTWNVDYNRGLTGLYCGSFVIGTERHAEMVARRKLARLRREDARHAARRTVRDAP